MSLEHCVKQFLGIISRCLQLLKSMDSIEVRSKRDSPISMRFEPSSKETKRITEPQREKALVLVDPAMIFST